MTTREALAALFILCGLACAAYAGFLVSTAAGFAVLGVCLLALGASLASQTESVVEVDDGPDELVVR